MDRVEFRFNNVGHGLSSEAALLLGDWLLRSQADTDDLRERVEAATPFLERVELTKNDRDVLRAVLGAHLGPYEELRSLAKWLAGETYQTEESDLGWKQP